nr:MAG TPA: hypothetical protein [Caudoviricetes sp.]
MQFVQYLLPPIFIAVVTSVAGLLSFCLSPIL